MALGCFLIDILGFAGLVTCGMVAAGSLPAAVVLGGCLAGEVALGGLWAKKVGLEGPMAGGKISGDFLVATVALGGR